MYRSFPPLIPFQNLKYYLCGFIRMNLKLGRVEIEKLVDKVLKDNPNTVRSFKNPKKRDFAHCYLGGSVHTFFITIQVSLLYN